MEKASQHGFVLTEGEFLAVQEQWYQFRKPQEDGRPVSLLGVTFEGLLTVTDAEVFRRALTEGIGRGKAYGMGMLTVVRAVEAP
jgi:CRISPR system Cascade subunit CasE